MQSITAYIAIGSNLGNRALNITSAVEKLRATEGIEVTKLSNPLENPAIGGPSDSPPFLNAAAEIRTTLSAHSLLHRLLQIEQDMGRQRREKWEPRIIDLDLLLFSDRILSSDDLIIPHPLMHERRFVLEPLAEIAPHAVHPALQMTMEGLLEEIQNPKSKIQKKSK
jgi:2-amino-4-hydroxy-6-hydroxymethyldihydropteridine diphosphokinase